MTETRLILGDARRVLSTLPDDHFQAVVTSPAYWGRRSYTGRDEEIGHDETIEEYLDNLARVFTEVARVLRPDGVLWLNVGDTAIGSGGSGGDYNAGGGYEDREKYRQGKAVVDHMRDQNGSHEIELTKGQWGMIPARLVTVLQARTLDGVQVAGWRLRSEIVWDKGRNRRENLAHANRPGERHESIYMLTRSTASGYKFHHERLGDFDGGGNVWRFAPSTGKKGKAPFPRELPWRCISLSCDPGDRVLDPFCGTGATLEAASALGCDSVGIDLDVEVVNEFTIDLADVKVENVW